MFFSYKSTLILIVFLDQAKELTYELRGKGESSSTLYFQTKDGPLFLLCISKILLFNFVLQLRKKTTFSRRALP
jgi:hypothetical protein